MSGNIVIRQGLDEPWELNGSDITKPDDIVLLNLAVGQLAKIGSDYGDQIAIQANVTAEIGEAVNIVQDRSAEVASKLDTWSQPVDFGITSAPAVSSIINKQYDPTEPSNVVVKLKAVMDILDTADVFYDSSQFVTASFSARNPNGIVSFVSSSVFPQQNISLDFTVSPPIATPLPVDDLIIYHKWLPGVGPDPMLSVNLDGTTYTINSSAIKPLWIPSSTTEITNLQLSAQASSAAANTALLLDKTQVLPTPSDTVDPATLPADSKVTLDVVVGDASATRFKVSDQPPQYYYPSVSLDQLKTVTTSKDLVAQDENTIVKVSTGGYAWVFDSNFNGLRLKTVTPESFVASPTPLQKASWLSQYSDKIVKITQRSAEQTNFLKMLTDRYTYFYDAATNVLQLLASLARQQARN
jgi:hypothetical protein